MGQHQPVGRRRAPEQRAPAADGPASHAVMASVWRAVSRTQDVLGRRRLHFLNTRSDDLLSEQLVLLAMLHDWQPTTESEASDLLYLLQLYVEPTPDAPADDVARAISVTVRAMAARRGAGGGAGHSA